MFREDRSVLVGHRPHRPNHALEARILYGRRKGESFISDAFFRQLRGVTSRKECKFSGGKSRPNDLEGRKTLTFIKLERCVKWLSRLKFSMARKMGKPVVLKPLHNSRGRRFF